MQTKKSMFNGDNAIQDFEANLNLSAHAHNRLFTKVLQSSEFMTYRYDNENNTHIVWPTGEISSKDNTIKLKVGERCKCHFRINFDCQCAHELAVNKKFIIDHWSSRWYSNKTYNAMYPLQSIGEMTEVIQHNKKGTDRYVDLT